MRKTFLTVVLSAITLFSGCNAVAEVPGPTPTPVAAQNIKSKRDNIPFSDNQLYAVAYLGYVTIGDMDYYLENYLDEEDIPNYYFP